MHLISTKIPFNNWIKKNIKYTDYTMNEFIVEYYNILLDWIYSKIDISVKYDKEILFNKFTEFIYDNYVHPIRKIDIDSCDHVLEYFDLKYSDDIHAIYNKYVELAQSNNLQLFNSKNDTYDSLILFVFSICNVDNIYNDESDEELYIVN